MTLGGRLMTKQALVTLEKRGFPRFLTLTPKDPESFASSLTSNVIRL